MLLGSSFGELFDLEHDAREFDKLWDDSGNAAACHELMARNFDALALAVDTGTPRVSRF